LYKVTIRKNKEDHQISVQINLFVYSEWFSSIFRVLSETLRFPEIKSPAYNFLS